MKESHAHQEKKLGRGLSALIGDNKSKSESIPTPKPNQKLIESIPLKKIIAGVYQPRKNFSNTEIEELAESIKENGLIQPIILRKIEENDSYEIIAGERRFRAVSLLGLTEIPGIVKKINNHEALEIALIENVQRADLSLIEEAQGYKLLIDEFSYGQEQIAKRIGKSRSHIANLLRLLNLPKSVQEMLDKKLLSMGHARAIINSNNPEKLAKKIIDESFTVRQAEDLVRDEKIEKVKNNFETSSKNTPAFVRTESRVKFVNSEYLERLERELSETLNLETKISYNSFKNTGKIIIKFDEFEKLQGLIERVKEAV